MNLHMIMKNIHFVISPIPKLPYSMYFRCASASYIFRSYCSNSQAIDDFFRRLDSILLRCISSSESSKSNVSLYQHEVIKLLNEGKKRFPLTDHELVELQNRIEDLTMKFDENSIYNTATNLIKMLIRKDMPTAKSYLMSCPIPPDDLELLYYFDQYTLEVIILNVLGMVFNSIQEYPAVRVSTLIEQLDSSVRVQANFFKSRKLHEGFYQRKEASEDKSEIKKGKRGSNKLEIYAIGAHLVMFLEERNLISLSSELSFTGKLVKKTKGKYFLPLNLYALCNFDLSLLPIKLNLPMVCPPLPWRSIVDNPSTLTDVHGGYLSLPTGDIYHRYRLLTSRDYSHFYIKLADNYKVLLEGISHIQSVPFEINSEGLSFILRNRDRLVELGFLMPSFLPSLNLREASDILRKSYYEDDSIKNISSFHKLLEILMKRIQRARSESFILALASAYDGYQFYLPAFLDFRGRIYRSGILHFHERDLARSLIVFAKKSKKEEEEMFGGIGNDLVLTSAAAFHYKSFVSNMESSEWYINNEHMFNTSDSLILFAQGAKRPFQFIASVLYIKGKRDPSTIPVTQDASSSAYQIMSYFLLDVELAVQTNLIPYDGKIRDLYSSILEELKPFMQEHLEPTISTIICSRLDRKLVKAIFMPLIYGKTVVSMARDILNAFSSFLTNKECYQVASLCFRFWSAKYPNVANLIRLISNIGWFSSALNKPVSFSVPFFTTVQDYMCIKPVNIWIYNRVLKKRRKVTLKIPTQTRDRRKTEIATFANFIHQKDAFIAMTLILHMVGYHEAPVYTVHDNFITPVRYARILPKSYSGVFQYLKSPLELINELILINLINNNIQHSVRNPIPKDKLEDLLYNLIPKSISKRERDTWVKRISVTLIVYEAYARTVCGGSFNNPQEGGEAHALKWKEFRSLLQGEDNKERYYSLHH